MKNLQDYYNELGISKEVYDFCSEIEKTLKPRFDKIDENAEYCQLKVLNAFHENEFAETDLHATTGYGYNDAGRDKLEKVYASIFNTEDALVRAQITCGTHALTIALSACLRPGDEILSPVGKVYDTLEGVIGTSPQPGSLKEFGISFDKVDLNKDGSFNYDEIKSKINDKTKFIHIQRSKGYDTRKTLSVSDIADIIKFVKGINPELICMVDNCYGEFVESVEPSDFGADLVVGSLIKNPGGGLCQIGGYICGRKDLINLCAARLTAPGLCKEVGASLGVTRQIAQGIFMSPVVTAAALKSAIFAANVYEKLGFKTVPNATEDRHDIIQCVEFGDAELIKAFCEGIQAAAPVDSYVTPIPWDMPGYDSQVIMAAGAFVSGSSIELSADAPIKPPYAVYFQGGLTYPHGKYGIMRSLQRIYEKGLIKLS